MVSYYVVALRLGVEMTKTSRTAVLLKTSRTAVLLGKTGRRIDTNQPGDNTTLCLFLPCGVAQDHSARV